MSKKAKPIEPASEFERIIRSMSNRHQTWKLFADWCEMTAMAFGNIFPRDPAMEERYQSLLKHYDEEEQTAFHRLLALTMEGTDLETDFLGSQFMNLGLGSHWSGQFFTPMHICELMAKIGLTDIGETIERQGFFTVMEPAVGAGAMVIAAASAVKGMGFNYQTQMHVTAIDIDATAANMAFIQLALHHIPAVVLTMDALQPDQTPRQVWVTPAHWMGGWDAKLEEYRKNQPPEAPRAPIITLPKVGKPFDLFAEVAA